MLTSAQETRPETTGSVTGHVLCADTQRPARLAQMRLVRVPDANADKFNKGDSTAGPNDPGSGQIAQTTLDGSFALRGVKPGRYFLIVDKDGYLSPITNFTSKELRDPSDEMRQRVTRDLRIVSVEANQTVNQDVSIVRGGSVSGTITYDDGTPASGLLVEVLAKGSDGKWTPRRQNGLHDIDDLRTDDFGRYRRSGLPAGEYQTEAELILTEREVSTGPMPGHPGQMMTLTMEKTRYSLGLYSGDKLRPNDAVPYTLGAGEDRSGVDLVFPLSKLHKVTGQIVARSGHVVNGGTVTLVYADDQSKLTEADVDVEDALFRMDFVPEGEFLLKVAGAKDQTVVKVENPKGYSPPFHDETRTVKEYGEAEQALIVTGETLSVVAVVPEAKPTSK